MKEAVALALLALAGASLWGWGWAACRLARMPRLTVPVLMAVGLGAVLFLGGALNVFGLVSPWLLDAIVMVGLILTICCVVSSRGEWRKSKPAPADAVAAVPLMLAAVGVVLWLMPPAVFNVHDDFEKYFSHPVRMLAAGTLTPNPLGSVGAETLGGQAFLQAFVVARSPVSGLGVVDAGFCFLLCVALAGFGRTPARWGLGALAAGVAVLAINPQVVNVSSVFSGAALIMAAVLVTATMPATDKPDHRAILLGLLYAGMIALKPTYLAFVGLHVTALALGGMLFGQRWRRTALVATASTAVFLSPWLILHLPLYLAPAQPAVVVPPPIARDAVSLVSAGVNGYGSSPLHYTLLAALCLATAAAAVIAVRRRWIGAATPVAAGFAAAGTAGVAYLIFMVVGGPLWFGSIGAVRYVAPLFIAVVPIVIVLFDDAAPTRWMGKVAPLCIAVGLVLGFWSSLATRVRELREARTPLVYLAHAAAAERDEFFSYNRHVLSGVAGSQLRAIQAFVPAGEKFAAWVMAPFHFDFRRNEVLTAEPAGLSMRWSRWPDDVRYFLLEYRGYAVRSPSADAHTLSGAAGTAMRVATAHSKAFLDELRTRSTRAKIVYDDGAFVLMRLEAAEH